MVAWLVFHSPRLDDGFTNKKHCQLVSNGYFAKSCSTFKIWEMFLVTDFSSIMRWNIIIQNHKVEIPSDSMSKSSRGGPLYCCNKEHEVSQVLELFFIDFKCNKNGHLSQVRWKHVGLHCYGNYILHDRYYTGICIHTDHSLCCVCNHLTVTES